MGVAGIPATLSRNKNEDFWPLQAFLAEAFGQGGSIAVGVGVLDRVAFG